MANDPTPSRLKEMPSWLISQASMHAHRLLSEGLAATGSRGYHYRLLAALQEFGPASQAALGRRTDIDRSDVVAALNELVARGMVKRSADPADRRRNTITITARGAAHLRRLDAILADVQDQLLAALSPAERRRLIRLLTRVVGRHSSTRPSGAATR